MFGLLLDWTFSNDGIYSIYGIEGDFVRKTLSAVLLHAVVLVLCGCSSQKVSVSVPEIPTLSYVDSSKSYRVTERINPSISFIR